MSSTDGMVAGDEFEGQKQQLQGTLDSLIMPEQVKAIKAGTYLANLPSLWKEATTSKG